MDDEITSGDVIDQVEGVDGSQDQGANTGDDVIVEGQADVTEDNSGSRDDFWKNKSYELERKLGNLTDSIPKIIEETIIKNGSTNNQQQQKEYTIAELEAYALEHPEHRPWVEEQKEVIREKRIDSRLKAKEEEQQRIIRKQQSEQRVLSNPKYAEAFVDVNGTKLFNEKSELAHLMHSYMNDQRLKDQPDAIEIAAKLAYADYVDKDVQSKKVDLESLKRKNAQLKQKTLVEGSGSVAVQPKRDPYADAADRLRKTGSAKDAQDAVKEYFKRIRG